MKFEWDIIPRFSYQILNPKYTIKTNQYEKQNPICNKFIVRATVH